MDNILWLHLILILLVCSVSFLYPRYIGNGIGLTLMVPIIVYTVITQLSLQSIELHHIGIGLFYVLATFIPSAWLIGSSNANQFSWTKLIQVLKKDKKDYLMLFSFSAIIVIYEELIWRVFLVNILSLYLPPIAVILFASFTFFICHAHVRNISWQSFEFAFFSLVLTTIYLVSSSLLLVLVIHLGRNYFILLHTLGDTSSPEEIS